MHTPGDLIQLWRDRLLALWCRLRGHAWAGARHHAAQSDGLLLCLRCGFEQNVSESLNQIEERVG